MVRLAAAVMVVMVLVAQAALAGGDGLDQMIRKDPARFQAMAEDLIAGFGGPSGLTPSGIEDHVALERAYARAGAMRRLLAMDLDNDGAVDRAELAVTQAAASAASRGRLERQFTTADGNGDGRIDPGEIRAAGQVAALRAMDEGQAAALRAMIGFDADGDGALRLEELRAALLPLMKDGGET